MQNIQIAANNKTQSRDLNIRLDEIGWALFMIMLGFLWFFPDSGMPPETWLVGAGLIMLGINFARYFFGIKMSGFTVFLGIIAVVVGLSGVFNLNFPWFAAIFIIFGASLLMRAFFKH